MKRWRKIKLKFMINRLLLIASFMVVWTLTNAQERLLVDKIVAVVGSDIIKDSEIENQLLQMKQQGILSPGFDKCDMLEELLYQKLLLDQSKLDSIEVTDKQIEDEINRRVQYLTEQIGSAEKLEKYYEKSILELRTEWRVKIKEQMLAQKMESNLLNPIEVTPNDVRLFYENSPKDSLPMLNPQFEILQIEIKPPVSKEQEKELRRKLEEYRTRIISGESFAKIATLYSDDPGSARNGGSLGFMSRAELVPEFANVAFKLKPGEVSRIVKTDFGFHIIEMVERRGEKVHVRHILLTPEVTSQVLGEARALADSVYQLILNDSTDFKRAAYQYSDDENTKNNGGLYVNPYTGTSKFDSKQIDPSTIHEIKSLKVGDVSKPFLTTDMQGKQVYKIIKLVSQTEAHQATLKDDYSIIKELALEDKKNTHMEKWVAQKISNTYIKIDEKYKDCDFKQAGWVKNN